MLKKPKFTTPSVVNGHTRDTQPSMWREHYKKVYSAEETPYDGDIFNSINKKISKIDQSVINKCKFTILEINSVTKFINTNKSYKRHFHWKNLFSEYHSAKLCLQQVLNSWSNDVYDDNINVCWNLFDTNLTPTPKHNKRELSSVKSWRPISVGTSENWIEKIF